MAIGVIRQHRATDSGEEWVHFPDDHIELAPEVLNLLAEVFNTLRRVFYVGRDPANVCRVKEQSPLNGHAGFQSATPGSADGGEGKDVFEGQVANDLAKELVGVEYSMCGLIESRRSRAGSGGASRLARGRIAW